MCYVTKFVHKMCSKLCARLIAFRGYSQTQTGLIPVRRTKLCVTADMVDSPTAVGVKGSSPLEVRKTFSMVLLEVRILLHTPSLCSKVGLGHSVVK